MTRLFAIFAILLITVAAISLQQAIPDPAREAALGMGSSPGMKAPGGTVTRVAYYYVSACQAGGGMCYSAGSAGCRSCCISVGYTSGSCSGSSFGDACYCIS